MKQFTTIEKLDTDILYALELASSVSVLLLAFGLIAVLATWIIRSKISTSRQRKIVIPCLPTQEGWCTIRSRQQYPHTRMTIHSCDGEVFVMAGVVTSLRRLKDGCLHALSSRLTRWTKPLGTSLPLQTLADLGRSKFELIAENALLRQQLIILTRQVKRPACMKNDRLLLVLLARMVRTWQQSLLIVQPDTLRRLASGALSPVLEAHVKGSYSPAEGRRGNDRASSGRWRRTIAVFGAERIRGELLKLGIPVCKRTRQQVHARSSQSNCASRKVIHVGVTGSPTDLWVAQQLREATPYEHAPKYLIRDNDSKFGPGFARVARTSGIKILKTPYHAPRANAIGERFMRSVRQECLDHLLILQERQLQRVRNRLRGLRATRHDLIKGSSSRSLYSPDRFLPRRMQATR